jgi:hypothetical protein
MDKGRQKERPAMTHITIEREALQTVLNALETLVNGSGFAPAESIEKAREAITAIKQAQTQPVQEPDPCPGCRKGVVCKTPSCERLKLPADHPYRTTPPAQPAQPVQEPVAWPCVIAEADFEQDTITLKMQCSDYEVRAGQHWLHTNQPSAQPAVPDAITDSGENPEYRAGWNECRETMLEMMK